MLDVVLFHDLEDAIQHIFLLLSFILLQQFLNVLVVTVLLLFQKVNVLDLALIENGASLRFDQFMHGL